ncbi:MAG: HTH domain-containing protein [Intestinibacter sp.]
MTAKELAEKFEVSTRTIYRDVEFYLWSEYRFI